MKVWYFSGTVDVYVCTAIDIKYWSSGGGKNTLYHCVWCFASVSAIFPRGLGKNGFSLWVYVPRWHQEKKRESKQERVKNMKHGNENLFIYFGAAAALRPVLSIMCLF